MWKSVTGERSSGPRATPATASELSSFGLYPQDSPLLGFLSAVSRPAVSLLQRWSPYLPGRSFKRDLVQQESDFLQQLNDVLPPQQLQSLHWFNLSELGIQATEEHRKELGLQEETVVSHVLLHPPRCASKPRLGALWSGSEDERFKPMGGALLTAAFIHQCLEPTGDKTMLAPGLTSLSSTVVHSLAPDLDNGYSSLEEEQLLAAKAQLQNATTKDDDEEEEREEEDEEVPTLKCENKAIAFIMGCPCSDDSGSDSSEDPDDDDGFDSDCSSDMSDSDDEEEEEEEDEFDSEAERLWSALCQNDDPYNPRNFTARLGSAPQPIPRAEPGAAVSSVSSSVSSASSVSSTSSSSWDEASETEGEVDNLRLLGAFCSSDPYSPLNFQAPIRTKPRPKADRTRTVSESSHCSNRSSNKTQNKKQVRFVAEVQVFSVGCEERCGPWEEFARDRARFAKRCGEIEQVLSFCLQPEHRRRVYLRMSQSESQEVRNHQSELKGERTGQSETEEEITGQSEESNSSQLMLTVFSSVCSYYAPTEGSNCRSEAESE